MEEAKSSEAIVINNSTEPCIEERELPRSEWLSDSTVGLPNHLCCVICKEILPSKDALNEHQSVHNKEKEEASDGMTPPCSEERIVKRARVYGSHSNSDDDVKCNKMSSTADSTDVEGASNSGIVVIDNDLGNEEGGLDLGLKL